MSEYTPLAGRVLFNGTMIELQTDSEIHLIDPPTMFPIGGWTVVRLLLPVFMPFFAYFCTNLGGHYGRRAHWGWKKDLGLPGDADVSLPDCLHFSSTESLHNYRWVADIGSYAFPVLTCLLFWDHIRLMICYTSLVYLLRAPLFAMTILPPCNPHVPAELAQERSPILPTSTSHIPHPPLSTWGKLQTLWAQRRLNHGYGIDLCPSGHTVLMACSVFYLSPHVDAWLAVTLFGLALALSVWIVVTRCHYSLDIPVAWILARWIWFEVYPHLATFLL